MGFVRSELAKYYYHDDARAKKFFQQAVKAAQFVMNSGKYDIVASFPDLCSVLRFD